LMFIIIFGYYELLKLVSRKTEHQYHGKTVHN